MKYLVIIFAMLVIIASGSCKKIENKDRHLYGRFVDSTSAPVMHTSFSLYAFVNDKKVLNGKDGFEEEASFSTDAEGNFDFLFRSSTGDMLIYYHDEGVTSNVPAVWSGNIGDALEYNVGEVMIRVQ